MLLLILYPVGFVIFFFSALLAIGERAWGRLLLSLLGLCWITWPLPLVLVHGGW
jgi:hypothetical protein